MNTRYIGKMARLGLMLVLIFCLMPSMQARIWTSKDGKKLNAAFVSLDGDKVELRLANGKIVKVPLDRLMIETDCPYLAPQSHRGRRNEPSYLTDIARTISEIRGIGLRDLQEASLKNSRVFFNLGNRV